MPGCAHKKVGGEPWYHGSRPWCLDSSCPNGVCKRCVRAERAADRKSRYLIKKLYAIGLNIKCIQPGVPAVHIRSIFQILITATHSFGLSFRGLWVTAIGPYDSSHMENLSLQDLPPAGGPNHVGPPSGGPAGPPQLPPQMFTTAAQLLDLTDSEMPSKLEC